MSEPNPFAFTGFGATQRPSSETSLRAEIARLNRERVNLSRENATLKDANGIAQALAGAKNRVQEVEREMKRAHLAERIAREALAASRKTHNITQGLAASFDEMDTVRKELEEKNDTTGKLQAGLETRKGLLDNTSSSLGDTSINHADCRRALQCSRDEYERRLYDAQNSWEKAKEEVQQLRDELGNAKKGLDEVEGLKHELQIYKTRFDDLNDTFDQRVQTELEDAHQTIAEREKELLETKRHLSKASAEAHATALEADGVRITLDNVKIDNSKLAEELKHQTDFNTHLSDINDNIRKNLEAESIECRSLRRERNDLQERLADSQLARQKSEKSEGEAHDRAARLEAEMNLVANDTSAQIQGLQDDIDNHSREADEHEQILLVKDERILFLERRNETLENEKKVLEGKLMEEQAHLPAHVDIDRPISYRHVSITSHKSMKDEFDEEGLSDIDDARSNDTCSELGEPETKLELSAVSNVLDIAPYNPASTMLSVSISDAVATTPRRQDSVTCSPVYSVSGVEPTQPSAPRLSMYSASVADISPSEPEIPILSLFKKVVGSVSPVESTQTLLAFSDVTKILDWAPTKATDSLLKTPTPALALSEHAATSISPMEPKHPLLTLTGPNELLDYAPTTFPKTPAPMLALSKHTVEIVTPRTPQSESLVLPKVRTALNYGPAQPTVNRDSKVTPLSLIQRSSLVPYVGSGKPSVNFDPPRQWPLEEEIVDERVTSQSSNSGPLTSPTIDVLETVMFASEEPSSTQHQCFRFLLWILGLQSTSLPENASTSSIVYVTAKDGISSFIHRTIHMALLLLVLFLLWRWQALGSQLWAWEHANGVGFGEGFSNVHARFGPYGNGHVLLSMLPEKMLSADSPLPTGVVKIVTKTVSAFEGLMGFGPAPTMV